MYPHERSLVKKLEGKPFALLGVNSDPKDKLKKLYKNKTIFWPAWWDGGSPNGPIAKAWNVRGWPTTYVLDARGVIRYKNVRDEQMEKAVDTLLREIENSSSK